MTSSIYSILNSTQVYKWTLLAFALLMAALPAFAQPAVPNTTVQLTYNCGTTVVTRMSDPPAQTFWYWQTSASGTSTALGLGATINRTTTGPLYLRALYLGTWSTTSQNLGTITVYTTPPAAPTVANGTKVFETQPATISVGAVSGALSYVWYQNGNVVSGQSTSTYTISSLMAATTYQVASKNGCESSSGTRLNVTANVEPLPIITPIDAASLTMGQSVTLGVTQVYATYKWRNASGTILGTNATVQLSQPGLYTVEVTKAGVAGPGVSLSYNVDYGPSGQNLNFVVSNTILTAGVTQADAVKSLPIESLHQSIQYFDGLGRPAQTVATQSSPSKKDLVTPVVYDGFGREAKKYLPYTGGNDGWFKSDALASQAQFYTGSTVIASDVNPYAETIFENSPLSRVIKQGAPGAAWQPEPTNNTYTSADHTIKKAYEWNSANEVLNFEPIAPNPTYPTGFVKLGNPAYYKPNQLSKTKTKDEHGNEVIEFVDKEGHVILKKVQFDATTYAQTYYVYDDFGSLTAVVPPEATKAILSSMTLTWGNVSGVSISGAFNNFVTKTTTTAGYNTGNATILSMTADGWVEMTAGETNKSRMIGLATTNGAGTSILFALEFRNDGNIYVWESNVVKNSLGAYATGTVVRVAREGTEMKYYVDGVYRQTSATAAPSTALLVDCAMNETGATLQDVRVSFTSATSLVNAINNYAFLYTYDYRRRMSQKKLPGVQPVYMVYDKRDRLVATQDGNQRSATTKYWTFTKYDELNRPIATGIKDTTVALTQSDMQTAVNNHYAKSWTQLFETYMGTATGNIHGYSNKSYPVITKANAADDLLYLTVTYNDNYQFRSTWVGGNNYGYATDALSATVNSVTYNQSTSESTNVFGQVTGTKVKVLDGGAAGGYTWLKSVNYYDDKYRVIQTYADNYKGGIDKSSTLYDFSGKVLTSKLTHEEFDVDWTGFVGTQLVGNVLKRTSGSTSRASSPQVLPVGSDGWLEVTYSESTTNRYIGLNDNVASANIDYMFQFTTGGVVNIIESGTTKKTLTGAAKYGDVFKISRVGTAVKYFHNSNEIQLTIASTPSTTSLTPDCYFFTNGGTLVGAKVSFGSVRKIITRRFVYDHAGRLTETWHKMDTDPEVRLVFNKYNELGQLIDKKLHSSLTDATDAKQSVDYRYNIRGWLTSINNASLATDGTNDDAGDLFGMNLAYNDVFAGLDNSPAFNGNISGTKWSHNLGLGTEKENAYNYSYDAMNRLTAASHKVSTAPNTYATGVFDESIPEYDLNGNIKKLNRNGAGGQIDQLTYDYGTGATLGNKLIAVADATANRKGFVDGGSQVTEYTYDANGNMTRDVNRGIGISSSDLSGVISYNFLNLPESILKAGNSMYYMYDATGRKLCQQVTSGTSIKSTYYAGEFVYENEALQFVQHEEGRIATASTKLVYTNDATTATDFPAYNAATVTPETINGDQYVKITSTGSTAKSGAFPIGGSFTVNSGEKYRIKLKAYRSNGGSTAITAANIWMQLDSDPGSAGALLSAATNTVTESTIEQIVTIPLGGTNTKTLLIGVMWPGGATYVGETIYINNIEITKLETNAPEYQYHLKDHLGNVRLTFTTKQETITETATYEEVNKNQERGQFLRYDNAKRVMSPLFDRTNGAADGYAQRLSGQTNEVYGLGKSLSVMPGDVINMEVYAKYVDAQTSNHTPQLTTLLSQIVANTAGVVYYDGASYAASTSSFPFAAGLNGTGSSSGTGPKAYLNWLVFNKDFILIPGKSGYKRMTTAAREYGQNAAHELLNGTINVDEPGYVYIYLSNEEGTSPYEVYFDDFKVAYTKSPVIQTDDYYPFGLTFNSFSRENSLFNQFQYNGKEKQDELDLGWLDYGARMYMAEIGRWGRIDALSDLYEGISHYAYGLNDPVNAVDPDGNLIIFVNGFVPSQWAKSDNRKTIPLPMVQCGYGYGTTRPAEGANPNYRPYPGERTFTQGAPTYLGRPFTYWGNEQNPSSGIGGLFSQAYNDYNTRFISASSDNTSNTFDRFEEGEKAGNDLIKQLDEGKITLKDLETIKIVGHSQGAAFAAGIATVLAKHEKYSSRLSAVYYLSPHDPSNIQHPDGVKGIQFSTMSDRVSSVWRWFAFGKGDSQYDYIKGITYRMGRTYSGGMLRGHAVDSYLDNVAAYFRSLGVKVTVK